MVRCPRCQSVVDETIRTTCPNCSTPLNAQPAGAPPSTQRPGARVSLTGEVIEPEAAAPSAPPGRYDSTPPGGIHPGAPTPARPVAPAIPRPAYGSSYQPREAVPDHSRRNALLINLSVLLFLVLLSGGGGWWFWMHRTHPKSQVERYLHAIQWLDWGVVYDLSATRPGNKTRHAFITMMDDKFDYNGVIRLAARKGLEKYQITVAEPKIQGDEATVAVTISGGIGGADKPLEFKLKDFGGVWKIYPLVENPLELFGESTPSVLPMPGSGLPGT